jgi:hypothetical protein
MASFRRCFPGVRVFECKIKAAVFVAVWPQGQELSFRSGDTFNLAVWSLRIL